MTFARDSALLPDDALPCIWMTAGLVAYKLCDREYECGDCPFDAALSTGDRTSEALPEVPPGTVPRAAAWSFPPDRLYAATHAWAQAVEGKRLRCGLDMFAGRLLDRTSAVILPAIQTHLRHGRPAWWIVDDEFLISFRAPASGSVVAVNSRVQQDPSLIHTSPYAEGWLIEMTADHELGEQGDLLAAAEIEKLTRQQFARLHHKAFQHASRSAGVGRTAADGGEPVADVRRVLGRDRYHRSIRGLLG